jgi:hypothetical protein
MFWGLAKRPKGATTYDVATPILTCIRTSRIGSSIRTNNSYRLRFVQWQGGVAVLEENNRRGVNFADDAIGSNEIYESPRTQSAFLIKWYR